MADPTRPVLKRARGRSRWIVYGSLVLALWGFWVWQPWEYDFVPRKPPIPNPPVDPESDRLFAPGTRVVVVTAHPDDAEFYIGGTLTRLAASGADLFHIVVTDGDKAYYPFEDSESNRRVRRAEQTRASHTWKAQEIVFLGYPDGRLRVTDRLVERLVAEFKRLRPDYVLTFDGEYPPRLSHQDHRRSGDAVALALQQTPSLARWLMRFSTSAPNFVADISDQWEAKRALLKIHASQFHGERLERVTNMVEENAIDDGERIGTTYGEGFRCIRLVP